MWIPSFGLITDAHFNVVHDRIDRFLVSPDVGRTPMKIQSGFSSFTAQQFKNWVIHHSVIVLCSYLSSDHLKCWQAA